MGEIRRLELVSGNGLRLRTPRRLPPLVSLQIMTKLARLTNKEKARLFDNPLSNLPPMLDPNFRWETMECKILTTREMNTWHLFNSLKMIWNNTVPAHCRVSNFKPYSGIDKWPKRLRQHAITCLYHELCLRPDVTKDMIRVLREMMAHMSRIPLEERKLLNAP